MVKRIMPAIACFVLAAVILAFADGYRRWYASVFFVVLGLVLLINARRARGRREE